MGIKFKIFIGLIFLAFIFLSPKSVYAVGEDCQCGLHIENGSEICNVGCETTVYCYYNGSLIDCSNVVTTYNECSGPAQCPGGCCGNGQCGLCEGSCPVGETWNAIGPGTGADAQGMCCGGGTTSTQSGL